MTDYYEVSLKEARLAMLRPDPSFTEVTGRLEDPGRMRGLFETARPEIVIHLAAQAGVRHSIDNPRSYLDSNITGTFERKMAALRAHPQVANVQEWGCRALINMCVGGGAAAWRGLHFTATRLALWEPPRAH